MHTGPQPAPYRSAEAFDRSVFGHQAMAAQPDRVAAEATVAAGPAGQPQVFEPYHRATLSPRVFGRKRATGA